MFVIAARWNPPNMKLLISATLMEYGSRSHESHNETFFGWSDGNPGKWPQPIVVEPSPDSALPAIGLHLGL